MDENPSETIIAVETGTLNNDVVNTLAILLEQFRAHRRGFDFLTESEKRVIIKPVLNTIDQSYKTEEISQLIEHFNQLILFQIIHPSRPNLNVHPVYRIHPIPVTSSGHRYEYANLPEIFEYNSIRKEVLVWNDKLSTSKCVFTKAVLCLEQPAFFARKRYSEYL